MYICICVRMYVCMYVCMYECIYVFLYVFMYVIVSLGMWGLVLIYVNYCIMKSSCNFLSYVTYSNLHKQPNKCTSCLSSRKIPTFSSTWLILLSRAIIIRLKQSFSSCLVSNLGNYLSFISSFRYC